MSYGSYQANDVISSSVPSGRHSARGRGLKSQQTTEESTGLMARPMPEDNELDNLFEHLLEKMSLSPEKTSELQSRSKDDKWRLLRAKEVMKTRFTVEYYLDQMTRHMSDKLKVKHPKRKHMKGLAPIGELLRALEVDLRTNPNNDWSMMFIDEPNNGVVVLIEFLRFLQSDSTERPKKKKYELLYKDGVDEHRCVLCMKSLMSSRYGFGAVLGYEESLVVLALSLRAESPKTRAVVLKLLATALLTPDGQKKVLKAFDTVRVMTGEERRFETLILQITGEPHDPPFQAAALCFINTLVHSSAKMNIRIFHQQEMLAAGFDPDFIERSLKGRQDEAVLHELSEWRREFVDVNSIMDEFVSLKSRATVLRDEINLLGKRLDDSSHDKSILERKNQQLSGQVDTYMNKAQELRNALQSVLKQFEKETGGKSPEGVDASSKLLEPIVATPPIEVLASFSPPPPPPPPPGFPGGPPPPPPPPGFGIAALGPRKKKVISNVPLPMLNWVPLGQPVDKSFFHEMDETFVYKEINFVDFEEQFEVKRFAKSDQLQAKREAAAKNVVQKVSVIESNRARNLVIAKRRIGLAASLVQQYIKNMDLDGLCADHVELLLKFIPTKDELSKLAKHAHEYDSLGEAEQFLFQMAKIERYESRLSVMAYMGYFDELMETVTPKITAVLEASISVVSSQKLRRLFEVILAFGNYMNSSRRGVAYGFRLESLRKLSDTRSQDRKQTLLHYLVDAVDKYYPGVGDFTEELKISSAHGVSMQTLAQDVQGLRKGIDLALFEREKQASNFVLYSFYNRAVRKVTRLAEIYKKMDEAYTKACTLFCENPKSMEPSEFFSHFRDFVGAYKKATMENRERQRKALEEANKRQRIVHARAGVPMQSVVQEAAAIAASRNQDKTPATWRTSSSPPKKRKEKKEKKEKKKDKKKKKGDDGKSRPGEVVMDEAGMIQVAHQPAASLPSAPCPAPPAPPAPPPLTAASLGVAEITRLSLIKHQQPPEKVELRMTATAPAWRQERAESMSSKAGSTADSGFSQSSTPSHFVSEDFALYDRADSVRTDSPASSTNSEPMHQPLRHKESSDGFYTAVSAGGETEDLYARVDSVSKLVKGPGSGDGSIRSSKAPPLPARGYLSSASNAMTDLTQYARVDGKEQDEELYATADN